MPGDPGAVETGGQQLSSAAEGFTGAGEGIRGAGGQIGGAWSGDAATAATGLVNEIGSRTTIGADASRAVGAALATYGGELRAAQQQFAQGEEMVRQGQVELVAAQAALANAQTAAAAPPPSAEKQTAVAQAQAAVDAANLKIQQGQQLMQQATQREQQANQAAATAVTGAQGQLSGMTVPGVGAAPAAPPAPPPAEEESGFSLSDLGHTVLDVAGMVPVVGEVADGANAVWYAAEGDYLNAGLSAAAMIPGVGNAVTAGKLGAAAFGAYKAGSTLLRGADELAPAVRAGEELPGVARAVETTTTPAAGRGAAEQGGALASRETDAPANTAARTEEPVDLASGLLFQPETDVELPGLLPLVLGRMHVSNYRAGRFFGPSWASTLDQHLQLRDDTVWFAREDAHVLDFPAPGAVPAASSFTERWTLHRDGDALLVDDLDARRTLHFTGTGDSRWLTAVVDRLGHRIDVTRRADGTPVEVRHSGGYRVRVNTALDRIVGYDLLDAGPDGQPSALVRFGYVAGNLTAIVNSSNLPFLYGYDDRGRITGWVDRIGTWYRHAYDDSDRVVRQTGSDGVMSADYSFLGDVVEMTDALGHRSAYVHDEARRIVRTRDACGGETRYAWGHGGRLAAHTDELGRETRWTYDAFGALIGIERADGATTTIERNALGLPVRIVEPDGVVSRFEYDDRGLRTAAVDPAGARTEFRYDDRGHLTAVIDALGGTTVVETDAAGLPTSVTDPLGATTRWERDAFGRVVAETDAVGDRTTHGWTLEGLLASTTTADGRVTRTFYDGERNVVAVTDPAGHTVRFERTHFEVPSARIDPDGTRTEYRWDAQVRLVEVRNPQGLSWAYDRDGCGRVVAETDFNGRRHTYDLDSAGQVVARRNALGEVVAYGYDAVGRVAEQRAAGVLTTFDHDRAGRLVRATTPEVDLVLERDVCGRVISEAVNGRAVTSSFDVLGRRTRRVTPTGQVSAWTHDAASRVTSLLAGVEIGFDHDAVGRETRRRAGAAVMAQEWGVEGLRTQSVAGHERRYSYRADGYLTAISGTRSSSFELDVHGHVTGMRGGGGELERYAYDAAGNVVEAAWPGADPEVVGERSYRGTLLTRAGGITYAHDAEGRVVRRTRRRLSHAADSWHYTWDVLDRLVAVTTPDGARWRYVYDALGRRVSKVGPDQQVDFAWDGMTLVEQVAHSPGGVGSTTWDHDISSPRPISQRERFRRTGQSEIDERFFSIVTDLVGAPSELIDPDGRVAGEARRSLWGRTTWTGNASTPLLFPGQYHDPETGFAYNVHRHYDPDTARYASLDPLGLAPAPNPNTYVHNPHTWLDPLGLTGCPRDIHSRYADGTPVYRGEQPGRLPTNKGGNRPEPWPEAADPNSPTGYNPHSQLRMDEVNNRVYQAREFDSNGYPVRDIDFAALTHNNGTIRSGHYAPEQHLQNLNDPQHGPRAGWKRGPGFPL